MRPKYEVEKVVATALDGDVELVGARARQIVLQYLLSLVEGEAFARAVLASLRLEHFQETVTLDAPYSGEFDVYICRLSAGVLALYGLEHVSDWYVKLKLIEGEDGNRVLVVSMHPPEKPATRPRRIQ